MSDYLDRILVQDAIDTCFSDLKGDPTLAQRIKLNHGTGLKGSMDFYGNCPNPNEHLPKNVLKFHKPSSDDGSAQQK